MAKPKGTIHRKFSDDEVRQIEVMGGLGMPMDQIAAIFEISKDTLERRVKGDKRIKAAIERGRAKASSKVRQTAFQMAISGENVAMTIFWLKVRERWSEPKDDRDSLNDTPIALAYDPSKRFEKPVVPLPPKPTAPAVIDVGVSADEQEGREGKSGAE